MELEVIATPSEEKAHVVTLRHIPESKADREVIALADKLLRGTRVIHTLPIIDSETCLSLMFVRGIRQPK